MSKQRFGCYGCYFYESYNRCIFYEMENFCEPDYCEAYTTDGNLTEEQKEEIDWYFRNEND